MKITPLSNMGPTHLDKYINKELEVIEEHFLPFNTNFMLCVADDGELIIINTPLFWISGWNFPPIVDND